MRHSPFKPDWSQIHQKRGLGVLSLPLALFSLLYGAGVRLRLRAFKRGIFKRSALPGFVVSIGNITTGGTGKTPAVAMLARWAQTEGRHVAVLSRGYGGRHRGEVFEVSDGNLINGGPSLSGDEPYLLACELSGVPVIVSKKRHRAGIFAYEKFGSDFFILDDGFQHLGLERDLNLALVDSDNPFGNGHLLPLGPLREPLSQLARADAFFLTRFSVSKDAGPNASFSGPATLALLKEKFPSIPVFRADHLPDKVVFPLSGSLHEPRFLRKRRVVAFAGIGHPEHFEKTLVELGANVVRFVGFGDHHQFKYEEIQDLIRMKDRMGAEYLLTTEKDWMRIAPLAPSHTDIAYLRIKFSLLPGQDEFFNMIEKGLLKKWSPDPTAPQSATNGKSGT